MRAYELMVILRGDLDEPVAHAWVKTVSSAVEAAGGSMHGQPAWWGKRRFAYPIDKREEGYYAVFELVAAGGALDELERSLRIADDVVRHKLLRLPEHEAARRGIAVPAA
jgi:small subunit ribosomal protein S6